LLELEKTDSASYRKAFNCGDSTLNDYIQKYARKQSQGNVSQTHILFDFINKKIISYYSVSAQSVKKESLLSKLGFPVKEIPGMLIGRLAVDITFRGKGYGGYTLIEALKKIRSISRDFGIKIVIVDALNATAVSFYKGYGFIEFDDNPMRLFLAVDSVDAL
jgi:predicted GNAT family N-acyltransferase